MAIVTTCEIKEQLARYLAGDLEPGAFRDWFGLALRDVHESSDSEAEALAYAIEWEFLDAERGLNSTEQMKVKLLQLSANKPSDSEVRKYTVSIYGAVPPCGTGSSMDVMPRDVRLGQPVGIGPSLVF